MHLASQPTLSRPIAYPGTPANRAVLHEAITELAGRRFRGMRGGHRQRYLTIDASGTPDGLRRRVADLIAAPF